MADSITRARWRDRRRRFESMASEVLPTPSTGLGRARKILGAKDLQAFGRPRGPVRRQSDQYRQCEAVRRLSENGEGLSRQRRDRNRCGQVQREQLEAKGAPLEDRGRILFAAWLQVW